MTNERVASESGLKELQICFLPCDVQQRGQVFQKAKQHSRHGIIEFAVDKIGLQANAFCGKGRPC
jgi:hypothetical protein